MANTNRVNGLRPVRHLNGSAWNGQVERCSIPATDSTAVFVGDLVKSAGSADTDGVKTVAQAAATDTCLGVVTAIEPLGTDLETPYRVASTARYVYVCTQPDVVYEIQEDGAIAATAVGNNSDIVVAAGDTTSGASGMELSSSGVGTATAQLRILGLVQRPDNEIGTNAKLEVLINEHEYKSTTGA